MCESWEASSLTHVCNGNGGSHGFDGWHIYFGDSLTAAECAAECEKQQGPGCCESRAFPTGPEGTCVWKNDTSIGVSPAHIDTKAVTCSQSPTQAPTTAPVPSSPVTSAPSSSSPSNAPSPIPTPADGMAAYDQSLGAPRCTGETSSCDTGNLVESRRTIPSRPEPNRKCATSRVLHLCSCPVSRTVLSLAYYPYSNP